MCGLFFGWRIGAYHFVVTFTLTLTSDLFLSPHFFKKALGILQSPPSVRPSVHPSRYLLLNHWTKSNQIWCVSYSHESGAQRHIFKPRPLGPWGGAKSSNIIKYHKISITKSISKFLKPNFVCVLTNERYKTYQMGFSFGRLGHTPRVGLEGTLGGWGSKKFQNSTRFGV